MPDPTHSVFEAPAHFRLGVAAVRNATERQGIAVGEVVGERFGAFAVHIIVLRNVQLGDFLGSCKTIKR